MWAPAINRREKLWQLQEQPPRMGLGFTLLSLIPEAYQSLQDADCLILIRLNPSSFGLIV